VRPDNATYNARNLYAEGVRTQNTSGQPNFGRVTGNFTGTTDQILAWAACKWGFPVDTVRAQAVIESYWHENALGDCNGQATQPETHGCESVGILQVRGAAIPPNTDYHPGTWPYAYESTGWNVDYALMVRRTCFNGQYIWLGGSYGPGDLWGCVGVWYSGRWHDAGAEQYIAKVRQTEQAKTWLTF
jgi:hypothetical protein